MSPQSSQPQASAPRPRRARTVAAICAVAGSLLSLAACGNDKDSVTSAADAAREAGAQPTHSTPSAVPSLSQERQRRQALVGATKITWDKAADTAVGEEPQSELVELDLERAPSPPSPSEATGSPRPSASPGSPQWAATVAQKDGTARIVIIDAVTGKVTESRLEQGQDAEEKQHLAGLLGRATQTPEQAVRTATDKQPGTVTGIQLDDDDNDVAVWEVEVANTDDWTEADFTIDAAKGTVVREQVDRD
ncbi:PepSY domain-containing protein [Streptomyces sp. NPDC020141]|uniref:PepSY domain-containing protein n=1 Tax=Streptomyces sp. NPDC020141 TaxID=3365065 RepID=UPI003798C1DE